MKKKVLIVDDDQYIRDSLSAILDSEGYESFVAEDKASTFEQINKNKPDVILMDVHMSSNQEGYDITRELMNDKNLKDIAVIILTSTEIISGGEKLIDLARKFRNDPQFGYINAVLQENADGIKTLEYKSEKLGKVVSLPVKDAISKPIDTTLLLDAIKTALQ